MLTLSANQLTGEIPFELGDLANLRVLLLHDNQLSGGIPLELGRLTNLVALNLLSNRLSGEIPSWLGNLANLELLHLSHNQMTGEIPPELGRLSNLLWLDLSGNQLSGAIPYELGGLTKLRELSFNDNQLIGKIPSELDSFSNLESLYLSGNWLSGCIPEGLRDVEDNDLDDLVLPYCSAAERAALEAIYNAADGPNWTNNANWLSDAPLRAWHGVDANEEGRVTELDLYDNQLRGEIPSELGDLANLRVLRLHGNQLSGEIPSELGGLSKLESLYLSGNRLSGCIPEGLRDVEDNDLDDLVLPFCSAAGATSADRSALEALYNAADGPNWTNNANWLSDAPLRAWYGVDTNDEGKVTRLDLHDNRLSGEIPYELGVLSNLESLYLNGNTS